MRARCTADLYAILIVCVVLLTQSSCGSIVGYLDKGRWPNPPPKTLSGTKPVKILLVEWVHPHVFVGQYVIDAEVWTDNFIVVEKLRGYREDSDGRIYLPNWVYTASRPSSPAEEHRMASLVYPPGSMVVVTFPLKGKFIHVTPEERGYGDEDILTYQGYLIRIGGAEDK